MTSNCSGDVCTDVIDISIGGQPSDPACSANAYCITTQSGFYAKDVSVTPDGGGSWTYTCSSCTGSEDIVVAFNGDTFTGMATGIAPDGSVTGVVPYSGICTDCVSNQTYAVSGTVCQAGGCKGSTGDPGVTVLVSGTDDQGNPVNAKSTTGADGSWSVMLPAGSYTAGPSVDGSTIAPEGIFTPTSQTIAVTTQDVTDVNFTVLESAIAGTVYGMNCSDKFCSLPGGIGGFTVLVKGTASDGTAVSESDVSDADDGSWSVQVPAGTYTAGLSSDGSTFVSEAMERPVTVANAPVDGVNFTSCAETTASTAQALAGRGLVASRLARPDGRVGGSVARAEDGSFSPSYCESQYTLKLTAKIPQAIVVDASKNSHYNTTSDNGPSGYNHSPSFINALRGFFRDQAGFNQEYPDCLAPGKVALYTQQNASAEWYSYIKAGKVIGTATVKLIWNQSTHTAELAGPPADTTVSLTRVFSYRVHFPSGKTLDGACFDRAKVPMLLAVQPIGNSNEGASAKTAHEDEGGSSDSAPFTIEAGLWFPFDAYGATIDPDTTLGERAIDAGASLARSLFKGATALSEAYERLPAYGKFLIETGANLVIGVFEEKVAIAALGKTAEWYHEYSTGTKLTAEELEKLELIGTVKGASELLTTLPLEAYNIYAGYFGYPVMSAVIRGQFKTAKYLVSAEAAGTPKKMPYETTLGVSISTTKFPTWSLKISRDALNTCLSGCKVWEGPLPWKSDPTGEPETFNPFSVNNQAYVVQNSAKNDHTYTSGYKAVTNVLDDTRQNLELAFGIRHKGSITSNFGAAEEEVPAPSCDADTGRSSSPKTICWLFSDWRP